MNSKCKALDKNFIQKIIDEDLISNKWEGRVHTSFLRAKRIFTYRSC